jgi:hypothetical protein
MPHEMGFGYLRVIKSPSASASASVSMDDQMIELAQELPNSLLRSSVMMGIY